MCGVDPGYEVWIDALPRMQCLPHFVRLLSVLARRKRLASIGQFIGIKGGCAGFKVSLSVSFHMFQSFATPSPPHRQASQETATPTAPKSTIHPSSRPLTVLAAEIGLATAALLAEAVHLEPVADEAMELIPLPPAIEAVGHALAAGCVEIPEGTEVAVNAGSLMVTPTLPQSRCVKG